MPERGVPASEDKGECTETGNALGKAWRPEGGGCEEGRGRVEPPAPSVSAAINAQSCSSFLSFLVVMGATHWCPLSPPPPPCSLLGTGPAWELNMAELVDTPMFGGQGRAVNGAVCPVLLWHADSAVQCGRHVQSPGTGQCPGGQLACRVCLISWKMWRELALGLNLASLRVWMGSVTPEADLPQL